MTKSLKEKSVSALFWNFMEKGGQQVFQIIFTFVLARLLTPDQYGLIGVLAIFTAIASILQESGFSSALIRNKDTDERDYATVFYFNITTGIFIYSILFFCAPLIAQFYDKPLLTDLARFIFFAFVFNSFGIIQYVHLVKRFDFRINAKITLFATLISGIIAIIMAYKGFGVWSLACQQVLQAFIRSILLWITVKWYPKAPFDFEKLKSMSSYSVKLLLNSIFNQITANIYAIIFAKRFTFSDTGYYTQAFKLGNIPQSVIAGSLQSVTFPLLNKSGDNLEEKKRIFRKVVRVLSFISFPVAIFTIVAAESIVMVILKDQWLGVIPILRIMAVGCMVVPLFYLLSSLLQSLGKSGLLLSIEVARNIASVVAIVVTINHGVNAVVAGSSCIFILAFLGGYHVAGKSIGYKISQVLYDIAPYFLISVLAFVPSYFLNNIIRNHLLLLVSQFLVGGAIYTIVLSVLGSKVMKDLVQIIQRKPFD